MSEKHTTYRIQVGARYLSVKGLEDCNNLVGAVTNAVGKFTLRIRNCLD